MSQDAIPILTTIIGTVVGSAFGQPFLGAQIGFMVGAGVTSLMGGDSVQGPRLENRNIQTSTYGTVIGDVYGTYPLAGNIIWGPPLDEESSAEGGKKGKSKKGKGKGKGGPETFTYFADFAVGICNGTIDDILRIRMDDELVLDKRAENAGVVTRPLRRWRWYPGNFTQLPDPLIVEREGAENVPAFRGTAYAVFQKLSVDRYGRRIPNTQFEVVKNSAPAYPLEEYEMNVQVKPVYLNPVTRRLVAHNFTGTFIVFDTITQEEVYRVVDPLAVTLGGDFEYEGGGMTLVNDSGGRGAKPDIYGNLWVIASDGTWPNLPNYLPLYAISEEGLHYVAGPVGEVRALSSDGEAKLQVWMGVGFGCYVCAYNTTRVCIVDCQTRTEILRYDVVRTGRGIVVTPDGFVWLLEEEAGGGADQVWITKYLLEPGSAGATNTTTGFTMPGRLIKLDEFVIPNSFAGEAISLDYWILGNALIAHVETNAGAEHLYRFDLEDETYFATALTEDTTFGYDIGTGNNFALDGRLVFRGTSDFIFVDLSTMTVDEELPISNWSGVNTYGNVYDELTDSMWTWRNTGSSTSISQYLFHRTGEDGVTLQSIVEDQLLQAGYVIGTDTDCTALGSIIVAGTAKLTQQSAADFISMLEQLYFFRLIESDGKLKAVLLGGASARTLSEEDDLGCYAAGDSPPARLPISMIDDIELPAEVQLGYMRKTGTDGGNWYAQGAHIAKRNQAVTTSKENKNSAVPVVLSDDEAAQVAEKSIFAEWAARYRATVTLTWRHMDLEPTDVVTINESDGSSSRWRIAQTDMGEDMLIKVGLVSEDHAGQWTSTIVGDDQDGELPDTVVQTMEGPSITILMDVPPLRPIDADRGFYWATASQWGTTAWKGTALLRHEDELWNPVGLGAVEAVIGRATTELGSSGATVNCWDGVNTVTIRLTTAGATLQDRTRAEVSNKKNWALLGDEIIGFSNVTLNADGTYTLQDIARGLQHTEDGITTHSTGERFVLLEVATLNQVNTAGDDRGIQYNYMGKSVAWEMPEFQAQFTNTLKKGLPMRPNGVTASRNGSNDLTVTWHEVNRLYWGKLVGPIGSAEASQAYEVDILDGPGGTVLRTITSTATANGSVVTPGSQTVLYDAGDQTTDGFTPGDEITVVIYQISHDLGVRGFGREKTV